MRCKPALVLCYHRVADPVDDPFGLCVHPDHFAAHLREIARRGEPSTLADVSRPSSRRRVVVTFDDGYADNFLNALPIAESAGVPITVFVTSGMVGRARGFWWDLLASLLRARPAEADRIHIELGNGHVDLPLGRDGTQSELDRAHRALVTHPVDDIERGLEAVAEEWGVPAETPPDARPLSEKELVSLAAAPMATIGAHTVDHARLSSRTRAEQATTISGSKDRLEEMVGRPVTHFAYPYGRRDDFDEDSVAAVGSAGFDTACTTVAGSVDSGTDRLRLPRRIVIDWGTMRFRAQLQRWRLP